MDLHDLLTLSQVPGIGNTRLRALVTHFKSPSGVFRAPARELISVPGIVEKTARSIRHFKDEGGFADDQLRRLKKVGGRIVTFWDEDYPENLKRIFDPPPYLFLLGAFTEQHKFSLAVVGTRTPSGYGKALAEKFAIELGRLGLTIVSGLARGTDTIAHLAAVNNSGRTIAVIGSGIDTIYPPENQRLSERIAGHGAVVSEFEMGAQPDAEHFPRRNRIISGLSLGTLIIESDVDGGAMITAQWALDQNREIFAVPGPVTDKRNAGCNLLIKRGEAKLVQTTDDILDELTSKLKPLLRNRPSSERKEPPLTLFEKKVFDALDEEPLHIDAIAGRADVTTADALVQLLGLEFKGLVKQLPGKLFTRV